MRLALLPDLLRAAVELLRARLVIATRPPGELLAASPPASDKGPPSVSEPPEAVQRVAYLIPRVAARLPWKADCLVQALAARRWLRALGYPTDLSIGVRKAGEELDAHAWLKWQDLVVTGGAVDAYSELTAAERVAPIKR